MKFNLISIFFLCLFIVSCDLYPQDDYDEMYVVESYLVAGRQLPPVRLSTTAPADVHYSFENSAVGGANVEIRLLSGGSMIETQETFSYELTEPGIYEAVVPHEVHPLRTYKLNITFPDNAEEISAYTVVPDTFHIKKGVQDSIEYRSEEKFEITVSESSYPGRQNIFIFNAISMNPVAGNLTPLYKGFYEDGGHDPKDLESFANSSSGIINEGNFKINPDRSFTIDYPWVGFPFYEENQIVANTIDDNLYDYVRSQSVQLGGSTLSPGEIQNVVHNIDGGIGIFGSMASDTTVTYVNSPGTPY